MNINMNQKEKVIKDLYNYLCEFESINKFGKQQISRQEFVQ